MVSLVSEEHTPVLLHKTLTLLKQNKIVDWNVKRCSIIIGFLIRHQIEYSASGITLRLDLAGHQGFREWLLQLPWFNKGGKLLDAEKGIKSDKKINYINRKRKKKIPNTLPMFQNKHTVQRIMVHRSDSTQAIHLVLSSHWKGQWNLKHR